MHFWAKTISDAKGQMAPGISVAHHCLNVGCVAEAMIAALPPRTLALLPSGAATLAALHDIGKITLGFQAKCPAWLALAPIDERARREGPFSVSDHALVSQAFLQPLLRAVGAQLWGAAVGAHHGRPKGRSVNISEEAQAEWAHAHRLAVMRSIVDALGPLPTSPPNPILAPYHSDLWLLAGLITVADWIGSNEAFFSPVAGQPAVETRELAAKALHIIGWPGGRLQCRPFAATFGFSPNPIQEAVLAGAASAALIVVEAPMGCGKTEAALAAAQSLIAEGRHQGFYFALPTQVTSNRIHRRVARFLANALLQSSHFRLAHGNSWLESDFDLRLHPAFAGAGGERDDPAATVDEARSWFASPKQALLAPYGVGTIDQALQGMVTVKHFFVRRFALAGKVVILDEIHSYDIYTGTLVSALVRELIQLGCTVIVLSATLTAERRRELLAAIRSPETAATDAYPLVTLARPDAPAVHVCPAGTTETCVHLRAETLAEDLVAAELIARAEAGQHVLWIRNTVGEAQRAFRHLRGDLCAGEIPVGLLHSRFPLARRNELEAFWLEHLGRARPLAGPGSILVATQVVEQSVDIDLDFIVSDLAPTDMLLQRLGRLWRHPRGQRAAARPEFWISLPSGLDRPEAGALKRALGRSARVYAPWVLLRTAAVFTGRPALRLPVDVRPLLEATYAAPRKVEPAAWHELHAELQEEKGRLVANATAAMLVFGRPMVDDDSDQALTRRRGPPTVSVALVRRIETLPARQVRLTALDGAALVVSESDWALAAARFLHHWLVRVPRWQVPATAPRPAWLSLHVPGGATCAVVQEDGGLLFGEDRATASYHPDFGVFSDHPAPSTKPSQSWNDDDDDDEFDD